MNARFTLLSVVFALCFSSGCSGDDLSDAEAPPKNYATLDALVEVEKNNVIGPLAGAKIYLFEEEFYQEQFTNVAFEGTTDALGKAKFFTLEKNLYYITVVAPDGQQKTTQEDTPARSITNFYVRFKQ
ncbi:MAG: hypothetical protein R2830_21995 [Saprospiraceae bacterium]